VLHFARSGADGEGLTGVDLVEVSRAARARALATASTRGLRVDGERFWIAGTAIRLVDAPTP
jgi:hypothetical protein